MKLHKWKDMKEKKIASMTPERRARFEAALRELEQIELREAREATGRTQADVAEKTGMAQGEISRLERRNDFHLSTVRRYVEALGGKLELVARFRDKTVIIRPSEE